MSVPLDVLTGVAGQFNPQIGGILAAVEGMTHHGSSAPSDINAPSPSSDLGHPPFTMPITSPSVQAPNVPTVPGEISIAASADVWMGIFNVMMEAPIAGRITMPLANVILVALRAQGVPV